MVAHVAPLVYGQDGVMSKSLRHILERSELTKHSLVYFDFQTLAIMFPKSLLLLAAVSSCCYGQQSAAVAVTGLDGIIKGLSDLTVFVKTAGKEFEDIHRFVRATGFQSRLTS